MTINPVFQVKFCKRNPGFMDSVRLGAVRAIDECQYQFRQRRWNCSSMQEGINNQINLIKAHLGGKKLSQSSLAGMQLSGLPALPSSSVYSAHSRMYDQQPTINAMSNFYTFKDGSREGRNSRNVRRRDRERRSRKGESFVLFEKENKSQ